MGPLNKPCPMWIHAPGPVGFFPPDVEVTQPLDHGLSLGTRQVQPEQVQRVRHVPGGGHVEDIWHVMDAGAVP